MANDANDRRMAELGITLGSPGWQKVMRPTIEKQLLSTYDTISNLQSKPPEGMTRGDYVYFLSGRADGLKYVLSAFIQSLAEFESQKVIEARASQAEQPSAGSPYVESANPTQEG